MCEAFFFYCFRLIYCPKSTVSFIFSFCSKRRQKRGLTDLQLAGRGRQRVSCISNCWAVKQSVGLVTQLLSYSCISPRDSPHWCGWTTAGSCLFRQGWAPRPGLIYSHSRLGSGCLLSELFPSMFSVAAAINIIAGISKVLSFYQCGDIKCYHSINA